MVSDSEHVKVIYTLALENESLLAEAERRLVEPNTHELLRILLAASDGGPQMVSGTTREWMALHAGPTHRSPRRLPLNRLMILLQSGLWGEAWVAGNERCGRGCSTEGASVVRAASRRRLALPSSRQASGCPN